MNENQEKEAFLREISGSGKADVFLRGLVERGVDIDFLMKCHNDIRGRKEDIMLKALERVGEDKWDKEFARVACDYCGYALEFIPDHIKDREMCEMTVEKDPYELKAVPDRFKTCEMCEMAVAYDPCAIQFVPDRFKTCEMCEEIVETWPELLAYVPDHIIDIMMRKEAVEKDSDLPDFAPDHLKDREDGDCDQALHDHEERELSERIDYRYEQERELSGLADYSEQDFADVAADSWDDEQPRRLPRNRMRM